MLGKYVGQFKDGFRHGIGIEKLKNGCLYEGEYFEDRKQGFGKIKLLAALPDYGLGAIAKEFEANKYHVYEGEFAKDKPRGFGRIVYADGLEYEGEWRNGYKWGKGCLKGKKE